MRCRMSWRLPTSYVSRYPITVYVPNERHPPISQGERKISTVVEIAAKVLSRPPLSPFDRLVHTLQKTERSSLELLAISRRKYDVDIK